MKVETWAEMPTKMRGQGNLKNIYFTECSFLGRSGLGLRGWFGGLCSVGSPWMHSRPQTA